MTAHEMAENLSLTQLRDAPIAKSQTAHDYKTPGTVVGWEKQDLHEMAVMRKA